MGTSFCAATAAVTGTGIPLPRDGGAFSLPREHPVISSDAVANNKITIVGRIRPPDVFNWFWRVRIGFTGSLGFRFRFPTSAQRLVQRDEVQRDGALTLRQRVLGLVKRTRGDEHAEKLAQSIRVNLVSQVKRSAVGGYILAQCIVPFLFLAVGDESVLHVLQ